MAKKYLVDRINDETIRVYPEKQEEAIVQTEVKKRRVTLYDYGKGNGFSITPQKFGKVQAGTVFKIKDFPMVTLHESKNKFFVRLSFSKATLADAEHILLRDYAGWFKFLREQLNTEAATAIADAAKPKAKPKKSTSKKSKSNG